MVKKERDSGFPIPISVGSSEIYPRIPPEAEIERQVKTYLELKFHKHEAIGMSKGKFKDLLMKLVAPQPESFRGRFAPPVIVFGQIPPEDQCRLVGINYFPRGRNALDWTEDPQQYRTPKSTYLTWTDEGARFMNRKVEDVRQELLPDERGGTEFDGIGLCIIKPKVLEARFLNLPGTAFGSGSDASLELWYGVPELHYYGWIGHARPTFGSLVCGRQK